MSHLGQSVTAHVILELVHGYLGGYGPGNFDWIRILADGSRESGTGPGGQFRVPDGFALVITDVDWQYADASSPGTMQVLRLFVTPLKGNDLTGSRVFESAVVLGPDRSNGAAVAMTTGFVVSSDARIGIDVFPGPIGPPGGIQHAILRGYLVPFL